MKINFIKGEKFLLEQVRSGDERAMEKIYFTYREEFIRWAVNKYNLTEENALDHYQESITIMFEKIINGTITNLDSSLKTYLFGIGKNRILQKFDKQAREEKHSSDLYEHYRFLAENEDAQKIYEKAKKTTKKVFDTIGEPCQTVLKLFYFEKKSMTEIAEELGYKNEGVARTTKKRCLEKIRDNFLNPASHE